MAAAAAGDEHVLAGDGAGGPAVGDVGLGREQAVGVLAGNPELGLLIGRLLVADAAGKLAVRFLAHPPIATLATSTSRCSTT